MKPDQRWARADALLQPGIAAHRAGRLGEAEAVYRRVIDQVPGHPGALNNLGMIFRARGDSAAAEAAFRAALVQQPHFAEAHYNRGNALANLTRIDEAIEAYRAALRYRPNYADAWFNLGNRLGEQGDAAAAKVAYLATLALKPDHVMAHIHLGNLWFGEMRLREALSFLDLALALTPNWGIVHNNRGRVLEALKHYAKALDAYAVAVVSSGATQEPDNAIMRKRAQANLLRLRQEVADWSGYADLLPIIERDADETMAVDGVPVIGPMTACRISDDPAFHRQIIAGHARQRLRRLGALAAARTPAVGTSARKIVLAYLSSTINENPTGFLLQGVIAHHDRDRFDVVVYNYGISADNPVRRAIRAVTPAFHDVSGIDSRAIAVRIRQDQCAILIDANVWADDGREDIAGRRPAPVQVRLGGVPCTSALPYFDYMIADRIVVPPKSRHLWDEQLILMPDSYIPCCDWGNPTRSRITRASQGLSEDAVVLASFNRAYKIEPEVWRVWMRILAAVPEAVLWLAPGNDIAWANLRRSAEAAGVASDRLVLAPRLGSRDDHLARLALADLGLDTRRYGGHTTSGDLLLAGVPFLTCPGRGFAARVGASLLHAAGLGELNVPDLDSYEAMAISLARNFEARRALRGKLVQARLTATLFDGAHFVRALERAYQIIWQRHCDGMPPAIVEL